MLTIFRTSTFKRDVKRLEKRGKDMKKLRTLLQLLIDEQRLPATYRDHALKGGWSGFRDLHLEPDWLLIYRIFGKGIAAYADRHPRRHLRRMNFFIQF